MLRKRSTMLTIRALSKVSFSPLLLLRSSFKSAPLFDHNRLDPQPARTRVYDRGQNPNGFSERSLDFDKRSNFEHDNQLNSGSVYGGNSARGVPQLNSDGFTRDGSSVHHLQAEIRDGQQTNNLRNANGFSDNRLDSYQRNDFEHVNRLNSSEVYGGNVDGYRRNNVGVVSQLNSNVNFTESSSEYRPNLNGSFGGNGFSENRLDSYKRSNFENATQSNSSRVYGGNVDGHQRGNVGKAFEPNPNGYFRVNPDVHQRNNYGEINRWNSNGFNAGISHALPRNEIIGNQQPNSNGLHAGIPNGQQGSNIGQIHPPQLNSHAENYTSSIEFNQNSNFAQNPSGFYRGSPNEFNRENLYPRSTDVVQGPSNGGFGMQNPHVESPQNPNGHFVVNPNFPQNPGAHLATNPMSQPRPFSSVDGSKVSDEFSSDASPETFESSIFEGTLYELDKCCKEAAIKDAVEVLGLLRKNGVAVDIPRYISLMQVCAEEKSSEEARIIHNHIYEAMGEVGVGVNNKIIDMYFKCGSMTDAYQLFEKMPQRNLTSWDTMISGLVNNNLGEEAIDIFTQFKEMGLKPDGDLFISVYKACGVLGAVDEGMLHFELMKKDFGIAPTMKHYISIVDMLGASGHLDEALEFIENMPVEPSVDVWETLMNFCSINGCKDLWNRCLEIVTQLDSSRLTEQTKMGLLPVKSEKVKKSNSNSLDFRHHVHELRAGDRSHPMNDQIYEQLRNLVPNMKEVGYIPNMKYALHDIGVESREEAVLAHSEKLAAAYALLTTPARSPIRIIKNLRFCGDCHDAMKIISKLTGRLIISRDAKRFHHFQNGVCSCNDYY